MALRGRPCRADVRSALGVPASSEARPPPSLRSSKPVVAAGVWHKTRRYRGNTIAVSRCHSPPQPRKDLPPVHDDAFVVNVKIVVVHDDQVLMIVRGDEDVRTGWLTFPDGKLAWEGEVQQALEAATARREVLQEVGLALVPPVGDVEPTDVADGEGVALDVAMLARATGGEARRNASDKVAEILWMTADEIMADPRVQLWTRASLALTLARFPLLTLQR